MGEENQSSDSQEGISFLLERILLGLSLVVEFVMLVLLVNIQRDLADLQISNTTIAAPHTLLVSASAAIELSDTPTAPVVLSATSSAASPTPTLAIFSDECVASIKVDNTPLRLGPGSDRASIETLTRSQPIVILGRTEEGEWYQVRTNTNFGWIFVASLDVPPTCVNLAIVEP